jgi:hypothetical protein
MEGGFIDLRTCPPVGQCIYCGRTDRRLFKEHIIPFALGGEWALRKASCGACADITKRFEQICTGEHGGMFFPMRARLKIQSRRGSTKRGQIATVVANRDGSNAQVINFASDDFPAAALGIKLPVAGIALGIEPTNVISADIIAKVLKPKGAANLPLDKLIRLFAFHQMPFLQMIAKIGFVFAVAERGTTEGFHPMLRDVILGKTENSPYLVGGGWIGNEDEKGDYTHTLQMAECTIRDKVFTLAQIHLFGRLALPKYHVVVCECPLQN